MKITTINTCPVINKTPKLSFGAFYYRIPINENLTPKGKETVIDIVDLLNGQRRESSLKEENGIRQ